MVWVSTRRIEESVQEVSEGLAVTAHNPSLERAAGAAAQLKQRSASPDLEE